MIVFTMPAPVNDALIRLNEVDSHFKAHMGKVTMEGFTYENVAKGKLLYDELADAREHYLTLDPNMMFRNRKPRHHHN
jgi:hypothetical protein